MIHAAWLVAVQAQPVAAMTATVPDPPAAVTVWTAGVIDDAHVDARAACSIVTVTPATVSVPDRAAPALRSTVNARLPLPLPPLMAGSVIQLAPLVAVQAQPPGPVTATVSVPPSAPTLKLSAAMEKRHGAGP